MTDNQTISSDNQVKAGLLEKAELSPEYIYSQALALAKAAQKHNLPIRLIGATAFINHCPHHNYLYKQFNRVLTDVDMITYSKTPKDKLDAMFKELGYEPIPHLGWHSINRDIYVNPEQLYIDVFKDELAFCHKISLIGRLELDFPTIPLADMMLAKLQVVKINLKDLLDIVVLLLEHDFGEAGEVDKIELGRFISLLSNDWGFYYTSTTNLDKVKTLVDGLEALDAAQKKVVHDKVNFLLKQIEQAPKSLRWKARAAIGTRMRWYEEVESVER